MSEHKVTCGVRVDVLEAVLASVGRDLREARVAHRLVVSGSGGWRFMDLVPAEAGKLQVGAGEAGVRWVEAWEERWGGPAGGHVVTGSRGVRRPRTQAGGLELAPVRCCCCSRTPHLPPASPANPCQALEYARRSLGFPPERTVACGDSGNDIGAPCCGWLGVGQAAAHVALLLLAVAGPAPAGSSAAGRG